MTTELATYFASSSSKSITVSRTPSEDCLSLTINDGLGDHYSIILTPTQVDSLAAVLTRWVDRKIEKKMNEQLAQRVERSEDGF